MLLWSDLCAGGDRDKEAEKRSLQVQIPNAQKRNQGLFMQIQIQIHYASVIQELFIKTQVQILNAQKRNQGLFSRNTNTNTLYASVDEGSFIHKYKSTYIAKQVQMLRTRMYV